MPRINEPNRPSRMANSHSEGGTGGVSQLRHALRSMRWRAEPQRIARVLPQGHALRGGGRPRRRRFVTLHGKGLHNCYQPGPGGTFPRALGTVSHLLGGDSNSTSSCSSDGGPLRSPAAISVFTVLGSDRRVVACAMAPSDIITLLEAGARLKIQPRGPREMTKIIEAAVKGGGHVEFKQAGSPKQMSNT
jgi:hypothetical protein